MKTKLMITDNKGYVEHYEEVKNLKIEKENRINHLIFKNNNEEIKIPLKEIEIAYWVYVDENNNVQDLFRYER